MANKPNRNSMSMLLDFLERLEKDRIWYNLKHVRETVMVVIPIPGERWEVEFFENGEIEIERFVSTGVKSIDEETLNRLLEEQEETNEEAQ